MRTGHKIILLLIFVTFVLGAVVVYQMKGNETDAGYMRWAISNNISLFLASPTKFLFSDSGSGGMTPGVLIGIGVVGLVVMVLVLKLFGDDETVKLRKRVKELDAAKTEAENALQEQVWKSKTDRQAKDSAMRDLESNIEKIEILLTELGEKERLLKVRESELVTIKTDATGRAGLVPGGMPAANRMLNEELKKKTEALQARDAAIKDLEQRLNSKTTQWETQLREKEKQVKARESELEGLRFQISDLGEQLSDVETARKRAEERLHEEARKRRELIEASEQASRAEEQRLEEQIRALEGQVSERDKALKSRDGEMGGIRRQLDELRAAKEHAESLLQEHLGQNDRVQQSREGAIKELEQRYSASMQALKTEVGEKNLLLEVRDGEINALQSEIRAVMGRLNEMAAARERAETSLEEILQKAQLRDSRDTTDREMEERYVKELEDITRQLREKEESLQARDGELATLKSEVKAIMSRMNETAATGQRAEASLQEELRKERQHRETREGALRELEERLTKELNDITHQLREKEESLQARDGELAALKSELKTITGRLSETGVARELAELSFQEELRKERQQRDAQEGASRELEERLTKELENLTHQLREKDESLHARDGELAALRSEVKTMTGRMSETAAAGERAEASLQEELRKERQHRETREVALRELEERHVKELQNLQTQIGEKEEFLKSRDSEMLSLKTQMASLADQLNNAESAKERAAALVQEKIRNEKQLREASDSALKELEENFKAKIAVLEQQLSEKLQTMGSRDSQVAALTTELTALNRRLSDTEAAKEKAESLFHEAMRAKDEMASSKDASIRELQDDLTNKIRAFETQLNDRDSLIKGRETELTAAKKQVAEMGLAKDQAARQLQDEIRKRTEELEEKEAAAKALEERFTERMRSMEHELNAQREKAAGRETELAGLTAKVSNLMNQLSDMGASKDQTTRQLQDELRRKSAELDEREAAAKALETRFTERVRSLESELSEEREQLAGREAELAGLTAKVTTLTNQLTDAGASKDQTARQLQDELRSKAEELEEKEAAAKALEERFAEQIRSLERELSERREQLDGRVAELANLTGKVSSLTGQLAETATAKDQTTRALQDEIKRKSEELEEKEAAAKALEERFAERMRTLESELSEQRTQVATREMELAGLTAKVGSLTSQLMNAGESKDESARRLEEDARAKAELLHAKETALKGLEERLSGTVRTLEGRLSEKQELLDSREMELETLMSKFNGVAAKVQELEQARGRTERQWQDELREKDAIIESKNADIEDLENRLSSRLKTLERQVNEKQKLLEVSSAEVGDLRAQMNVMEEQLKEAENAKSWLENALQEERNKASQALVLAEGREPAVIGGDGAEGQNEDGLDNIRSEREELLKARDKLINDLMGELKEKKSQLAKHEIEVWQGIERRGVWKHRLSKIGIRLKD